MHTIILVILLFVVFFASLAAHSQTYSEWWQQKKTRIQYLKQQAIALQALSNTVEKGYQLAEHCIQSLRDIQNDEFNLHEGFFHSLQVVNPAVANGPELSACITEQRSLVDLISKSFEKYSQSPWLKSEDLIGILAVYNFAVTEVQDEIQLLHTLVTDTALKMTDGERLSAIQSIEDMIKKRYLAIELFSESTEALISNRQSAFAGIRKTLHLYE